MEKQYSEEFFCTFVDNLQKLCRNLLDFEQVCEVSGYVCLMMDNSKQERYVLSEMVHNSGSVISESYCTKAFRTLPLLRNAPKPNKHHQHDFEAEFEDDYDSSMDSYTHSSMDSFPGEIPHDFTDIQHLHAKQKNLVPPAVDPDNRKINKMTKPNVQEESMLLPDKEHRVKTEVCNSKEIAREQRNFSPKPPIQPVKRMKCDYEEMETLGKRVKPVCAAGSSTLHEQSVFSSHGAKQRVPVPREEEFVQVKQEPEDPDFMSNVEINSNIGGLDILKDEYLIAEPIGYLKPKAFSNIRGPKTKTTPRKVYVPLKTSASSRPGGSREIQPRKYIKLMSSDSPIQTAHHLSDHHHEEHHSDSDSEFLYDSASSSCDDMEDHYSYGPVNMDHDGSRMSMKRSRVFNPSHKDQDKNLTPDSRLSFVKSKDDHCVERYQDGSTNKMQKNSRLAPAHVEKDLNNMEAEKARSFAPGCVEQGGKLPPDRQRSMTPSHSEEDASNSSSERYHSYLTSRPERSTNLSSDKHCNLAPAPSEKDDPSLSCELQDSYISTSRDQGMASAHNEHEKKPNLAIEREDVYTSSHMEKGIALRAAAVVSGQGDKSNSSLSVERQDMYTSSHMEQGLAPHTAIKSIRAEQDKPNLSIEREDIYTSTHMEQGIALRSAVGSGHGEKDNSTLAVERKGIISSSSHKEYGVPCREPETSSLSIEREDVYTSSHMEQGIALRAAAVSGQAEKDHPNITIEREDTYTSSHMEQGIALRLAAASAKSDQDISSLSLDSHHSFDPQEAEHLASSLPPDSCRPFASCQMEPKMSSLPADSQQQAASSGQVDKGSSNISDISLMDESGDEIIELDSDEIEEDEGLAAATASLAQQRFSRTLPNEPSTSSQSIMVKESMQKHMIDAVNLFTEFLRQKGCSEPMHLISSQKLDLLLSDFYENVKKNKKGEEFTPFSLKSLQNRLQKYLHEHEYPYSITSDSAFLKSRETLRNKLEALKCKVKNIPQKVDAVTEEDVEILFQKKQLGAYSPDILFNSMWFMNTMFLGVKSRTEHCNLKWGDIVLNIDHTGREFLRYVGPKQTVKNRSRPLFADMHDPERCFVELYKIFEDRRHEDLLKADAPFYGTVNKFPAGEPWFLPEPMPSARFNGLMQKMAKEAGLTPGRKFTNSSGYIKSFTNL